MLMNPEKRLLAVGYRPDTPGTRQRLLRPARLRGAAGQPLRHRQGRPADRALAAPRPAGHRDRDAGRAAVLVGVDVRIPDAAAGDARADRRHPQRLERAGGRASRSATAARLGLPWGVSESAFNARDREMNYQYHAFGSPDLALKRMPGGRACCGALRDAAGGADRAGGGGARTCGGWTGWAPSGLSATSTRSISPPPGCPRASSHVVVRNFMAHHHGMSIVADRERGARRHPPRPVPFRRGDPGRRTAAAGEGAARGRHHHPGRQLRAARDAGSAPPTRGLRSSDNPAEDRRARRAPVERPAVGAARLDRRRRRCATTSSPSPAGGPTRRSTRGGTLPVPARYRQRPVVVGHDQPAPRRGRAGTRGVLPTTRPSSTRPTEGLESLMEVIVAVRSRRRGPPPDPEEHRRPSRARIEVTSYGEIVLDRAEADLAHPAFSKMFVQTAIRDGGRTITASRNPRGAGRPGPAHGASPGRHRRPPPGRGRDRSPRLHRPGPRSWRPPPPSTGAAACRAAQGFTLDPIFAIRHRVTIPPGKEVSLTFWTVVADTAEELDAGDPPFPPGCRLRPRGADGLDDEPGPAAPCRGDAGRGGAVPPRRRRADLAGCRGWRCRTRRCAAALGRQDQLWPLGMSGDRPILLLRTDDEADLPIVRKAVRMADYFRLHGLPPIW